MLTKFQVFLTCMLSALMIILVANTVVTGETAKRVDKIEQKLGIKEIITDSVQVGIPAEFEFDNEIPELIE